MLPRATRYSLKLFGAGFWSLLIWREARILGAMAKEGDSLVSVPPWKGSLWHHRFWLYTVFWMPKEDIYLEKCIPDLFRLPSNSCRHLLWISMGGSETMMDPEETLNPEMEELSQLGNTMVPESLSWSNMIIMVFPRPVLSAWTSVSPGHPLQRWMQEALQWTEDGMIPGDN